MDDILSTDRRIAAGLPSLPWESTEITDHIPLVLCGALCVSSLTDIFWGKKVNFYEKIAVSIIFPALLLGENVDKLQKA